MLPKGTKNGMPISFFVIVNPYEPRGPTNDPRFLGVNDNRAEGFPFDRRVYEPDFEQPPNTHFKDLNVFLKNHNEVWSILYSVNIYNILG